MRHVILIEEDKIQIEALLSKGTLKVRSYKRALSLQYLDSGNTYKQVSDLLSVSLNTLITWATNYRTDRLPLLIDKPAVVVPLNSMEKTVQR